MMNLRRFVGLSKALALNPPNPKGSPVYTRRGCVNIDLIYYLCYNENRYTPYKEWGCKYPRIGELCPSVVALLPRSKPP